MSADIKLILKSSNLIVREYVKKLEIENVNLQKKIAKLECNGMSQKHEISALKKKLNEHLKKDHLTIIVNRNVSS